jgi:NADH:ubiquinone reductase (H+-translocating)
VSERHRVIVVGGGFGGINAVKKLRDAPVDITLVDRRNFHLFQPLTYQVATGALSPGEVAYPLRALFRTASNVRVLLAEVTDFDLHAREVSLAPIGGVEAPSKLPYDSLIVAAGSSYSYFGHDEWADIAAEVKSMESALTVRARILAAFERAEMAVKEEDRDAELTFVIVGGGPTGVEMAGQIGELARDTLRRDFRSIDPGSARVLLVEAVDRVLLGFPPTLSAKAVRQLRQLGVTPIVNRTVVGIDEQSVTLQAPGGGTERVPARTVIWAAGVSASGLATRLGELSGAEIDRAGRLAVDAHLTLRGHPDVIALGDMVDVHDEHGEHENLPGVAPVAIQQGHYAARLVRDRLEGRATPPFHYFDKGNVATIGRGRAVADLGVVRLSGPPAWLVWLLVHLFYLIGFQNRVLVLIRWLVSFWTHGRGARLITSYPAGETGPRA